MNGAWYNAGQDTQRRSVSLVAEILHSTPDLETHESGRSMERKLCLHRRSKRWTGALMAVYIGNTYKYVERRNPGWSDFLEA